MRILVDYRPALRARTGVGEYAHEIIRAYSASHRDAVTLFTSSWKDRPDPGLADEIAGIRVSDHRVPVRVLNALWHRASWPPVESLAGPQDVVHSFHPLLIPTRGAAQVVTVNDLYFLTSPGDVRGEIRRDYTALAGAHARRADAVVAISHHTKRLTVERLGVDPSRVHVCLPGAPSWRTLGDAPNLPPDGYVLFVGTLEPRKNVGLLLDAYELLLRDQPCPVPRLVLAGRSTPDAAAWLARLAVAPLLGRVEHRGYVAHEAREALYAGALALVLPSLDEGFGLPVVEAMSAGVPVIASDRGALPEVMGDAGTLVDAGDAGALAAALARVIHDRTWARSRALAGLERARAYTWQAAAAELGRAYDSARLRRAERSA
jgi:glycosyltransferase involved in cell wall biosynthesis